MGARNRGFALAVMTSLIVSLAVPAAAEEGRQRETGAAAGSNTTVVRVDRTAERPTVDRPIRPDDDRNHARRCCQVEPKPERCIDRPQTVSVRQLIWRLIEAGEWRELHQLLIRLGII